MTRMKLDKAVPAVKKFIKSLKLDHEGVELEMDGKVVAKVVPPSQLSDAQKQEAVQRAWELMRRARERNRGVSSRVIAREVRDAVDEVRRRRRP